MAQAGEAPDIAEISSGALGTFVEMGVAIDIAKYMSAERLADYDANAVEYMSLEGTVYGLPLYLTIQSIGANKTLMEELGIDVAKIQNEGWTYEEFLDVIAKGTTDSRYGFVFANSGVTASDMLNIFGAGAGLSNNFTEDLKYTFTSENMLVLLTAIEEMTKSGYMPNYGVEAGQRMVMCQTGNAMIFGKAMPLFESNFKKNNAALEANDGTAVENSLPMEYAFLPVPTMMGCAESCYGTVDGLIAMRNKNTTDEHLANVLLFMDYICSGDRIASCMNELYLDPVCQSGRDALVLQEGRDEQNLATAGRCIGLVQAPPAGITAEMTATAKKLMDEVIVPKFQLLLAGEATAQEVYDYICEAAYAFFGEENCVAGKLG
jgi:multiple sugar transport system substrate-binding protein